MERENRSGGGKVEERRIPKERDILLGRIATEDPKVHKRKDVRGGSKP